MNDDYKFACAFYSFILLCHSKTYLRNCGKYVGAELCHTFPFHFANLTLRFAFVHKWINQFMIAWKHDKSDRLSKKKLNMQTNLNSNSQNRHSQLIYYENCVFIALFSPFFSFYRTFFFQMFAYRIVGL